MTQEDYKIVLLLSKQVYVQNPANSQTNRIKTQAFFDQGSQPTFITEALAQQLQLKPKSRRLIKELWQQNQKWDDPIDPEKVERWHQLTNGFINQIIRIPLLVINPDQVKLFEIHVFSDGSKLAYATTVYLRQLIKGNQKPAKLIFAKSRLNPNKPVTIPQMELLGVTIGSRAAKFVRENLDLPIKQTILWVDSKCVLFWLLAENIKQKVFESNRIREIKASGIDQFKYVPTAANPADLGTRGTTFKELAQNTLYWNGPIWLASDETHWPPQPETTELEPEPKEEASETLALAIIDENGEAEAVVDPL
uniref:Peptidase aspartic putative domain-containing protein n=1 Tax=Acrobeloides nanus TaxID=290746 RepID=A0A914CJ44_9BILA